MTAVDLHTEPAPAPRPRKVPAPDRDAPHPSTPGWLHFFDRIVINSSAGKDSQTMLRAVVARAHAEDVFDRLVVQYNALPKVVWPGTELLAHIQAARYQLPVHMRSRRGPDLLEDVRTRRKRDGTPRGFPDWGLRWCCVICTCFTSLVMVLSFMIKEFGVDLRVLLMEGRGSIPAVGEVFGTGRMHPPYVVRDGFGVEVEPVTGYLRDLAVGDCSPLTSRSYAFGLLRWFRLLWLLDVGWERATEAEVAVLVGWLRSAPNPQRQRSKPQSPPAGSVNARTGKAALRAGYAPSTINHALSVVSGFYQFQAHHGRGPVVNPVPVSPQRRRALGHRSPLETKGRFGRARLRQRVSEATPRAIPDRLWDELFDAMDCDRDRALLEFFVSSGARAAELLGLRPEDIDWGGQRIWVISKGSRARQMVPASPKAFVFLARYLDDAGTPAAGKRVWRTRRGEEKPLDYSALRRVLQRANQKLGTNWTLHDLRHTAATRMANGGKLTLAEVQTILRHADIRTTGRYLTARLEDLVDKLAEHYNSPRPQISYSAGYDPDDIAAVFGA